MAKTTASAAGEPDFENHVRLCPNCGHCPTCGRSNRPTWPQNPYYPWVQPFRPYITWGTDDTAGGSNFSVRYTS